MIKRSLKYLGKSSLIQWPLAVLIALYMRLVFATNRWQLKEWQQLQQSTTPSILAFWHGRLFLMPLFSRSLSSPIHVMISTHTDGELIARVSKFFGAKTIRGSSRRGRVSATKEALAHLNNNAWVGITPDGPKGPRQRVKSGLIQLAKKTGTPIIPVAYATSHGLHAQSWDEFFLPLPFGRGAFCIGEAMTIPDTLSLDDAKQQIENAMQHTLERACNIVSQRTPTAQEVAHVV